MRPVGSRPFTATSGPRRSSPPPCCSGSLGRGGPFVRHRASLRCRPPRSLLRFIGTAIAGFLVLRALAVTGFYPPFFRATASLLFLGFGSHRIAKLSPFEDPEGDPRYRSCRWGPMPAGRRTTSRTSFLDTLRVGYVPTGAARGAHRGHAHRVEPEVEAPRGRAPRRARVRPAAIRDHGALRVQPRGALDGQRLLALTPAGTGLLAGTAEVVSDDYHLGFVVPIVIWLGATRRDGRYPSFFSPRAPYGRGL